MEALGGTAEEPLAREDRAVIPKFRVIPSAKVLRLGGRRADGGTPAGLWPTVTFADGKATVNDATVTAADVDTNNGVIPIIDVASCHLRA